MRYTQYFRSLREAKGFSHEGLARKAGLHRNTVINIESGRSVRFGTIAKLIGAMGYDEKSPELSLMALLWVESVSGIRFATGGNLEKAKKKAAELFEPEQQAANFLAKAAVNHNLTLKQIKMLTEACIKPEVMAILENISNIRPDGVNPLK